MRVLDRLLAEPATLLRAVRDPALVGLGLNRTYHELTTGGEYDPRGTDIFEDEDWDTLILLDACRHDVYEELTPFAGPVERRRSRGSASRQFVRGNFAGKTLHDVVYVSGNRWYLSLEDELGCELHAYHDVERDVAGGFVSSPAAVTEAALDHADRYPDKRLLVHYMQPHYPYLGTDVEGFELVREGLRETVRASDVDYADVRRAYRDNLALVLEHVQRLVAAIDGKTVVSSDHGEMLGDRLSPVPVRWVGHPPGIFVPALVTVPWQVVADGPRRHVVADPPVTEQPRPDSESVDQTLRALGYRV